MNSMRRIYEVAEYLSLSSGEVLLIANKLGIPAKGHSSSIDDTSVQAIINAYNRTGIIDKKKIVAIRPGRAKQARREITSTNRMTSTAPRTQSNNDIAVASTNISSNPDSAGLHGVDREVFLRGGPPGVLGKMLGGGGEGSVYALENHPPIAIKVFAETPNKEFKVKKLLAQLETKDKIRSDYIIWPKELVCDKDGNVLGYAMKRVSDGIPMSRLAHAMLWRDYFPSINRGSIADLLVKLCRIIEDLHKNEIIIGDMNLDNILVSSNSTRVHLIDTDSMQIKANGETYKCLVGRPEFTPPELHGKRFEEIERTVESDLFSLGIISFQALMLGQHPYSVIGGTSTLQNIQTGYFPYGRKGKRPGEEGAIPIGPWYNLWSHLTGRMKQLFLDCFDEDKGSSDPALRPTLAEWIVGLNGFAHEVRIGRSNGEMRPSTPKPTRKHLT